MAKQQPTPDRKDWWACSCVKRNRKGELTHIKLHPPDAPKCRRCGSRGTPVGKKGGSQ